MSTQTNLQISNPEIVGKLNNSVASVISAQGLIGFEKAYLIANAAQELKKLLTPEYMKPIMAIQGNRLGFKTDKDSAGGYPETVVKDCLIEAVLMGVQPFGNQFNIISGNCYITKEGYGYLLANFKGLSYQIVMSLPRIKDDKSGAAIVAKVKWKLNGEEKSEDLDIPVKMNAHMGTDAVIGKATRKARAWLYATINGSEVADGDVEDVDFKVVVDKPEVDKEEQRMADLINACTTLDNLKKLLPKCETSSKLMEIYDHKEEMLKNGR